MPFAKIIIHLSKLVEQVIIDPVLLPAELNKEMTDLTNNLNNLPSNLQSTYIDKANKACDYFLHTIMPFVINGDAAKAAGQAIRQYREAATNRLEKLKDLASGFETQHQQINQYHNTLLINDEERICIKTQIEGIKKQIGSLKADIENFHTDLTKGDGTTGSIMLQIENAQSNAKMNSDEIAKLLTNTQDKLDKLTAYHTKVFGEETDDGTREGGLKQEIETHKKRFVEYETVLPPFLMGSACRTRRPISVS